jgi:hypothetical protein
MHEAPRTHRCGGIAAGASCATFSVRLTGRGDGGFRALTCSCRRLCQRLLVSHHARRLASLRSCRRLRCQPRLCLIRILLIEAQTRAPAADVDKQLHAQDAAAVLADVLGAREYVGL